MSVSVPKLHAELRAAGVPVVGVSGSKVGRVDFADGTSWTPGTPTSNAQERAAAVVLAAHDPAPSYAELRAAEYDRRGATAEAMIVALWERIVEGRPAASDAIQTARVAIKAAYPKPGA